jgi:hypothetical protein
MVICFPCWRLTSALLHLIHPAVVQLASVPGTETGAKHFCAPPSVRCQLSCNPISLFFGSQMCLPCACVEVKQKSLPCHSGESKVSVVVCASAVGGLNGSMLCRRGLTTVNHCEKAIPQAVEVFVDNCLLDRSVGLQAESLPAKQQMLSKT